MCACIFLTAYYTACNKYTYNINPRNKTRQICRLNFQMINLQPLVACNKCKAPLMSIPLGILLFELKVVLEIIRFVI